MSKTTCDIITQTTIVYTCVVLLLAHFRFSHNAIVQVEGNTHSLWASILPFHTWDNPRALLSAARNQSTPISSTEVNYGSQNSVSAPPLSILRSTEAVVTAI